MTVPTPDRTRQDVQDAPAPAASPAPAPDSAPGAGVIEEAAGWIEDEGAFVLPLGAGVRLGSDVLGSDARVDIPLNHLPPLPGLTISEAKFNRNDSRKMVELLGTTAIPLVRERPYSLGFARDGRPSGFNVRTNLAIDWLDNPELRITWSPDGGLSTRVTVPAVKFVPAAVRRRAQTEGDLVLSLTEGRLAADIDTRFTLPDLVEGQFQGAFATDGLSARVHLTNKAEWLGEASAEGSVSADGSLSARLEKTAGELVSPVPGLRFTGGRFAVTLDGEGGLGGSVSELGMDYGGIAQAHASFSITNGAYAGNARLNLTVPGMSEASGQIAMANGKLSGSFTLGRDSFPEGLPLENGSITGRIGETGALSFSGSVAIRLGPAGRGELQASYEEEGGFSIGVTLDLSIPGLQTAQFTITYDGSDITGEGELAVDPELLSGIEGAVSITYTEGRWAGETTLGYSADNGKLSGEITVRVRQAEDDSLKVSGDGEVVAQIAPRLQGTLRAEIKEEGGIDISGEIVVTEPLEMFPEARFERELVNISRNIPLWAILVAVLRIRAGVRAGVGPGVFRDIRVTGSYSIGEEGEPSFAITGEMYIPAFVEGYVGFGAGLGASVVLGSLTGGIEAMGTAGIYGAISVIPELAYEDGDYSIEGVATMAAGARLKLSLNAWAEVEALWVTVWENTWELASVTMPVGPDLGLQATMSYTFGSPEPPSLDFSTSDIDTDRLIQDAMPKDSPPSTGTREAVRNEARWQGAQRAAGPEANAVPDELEAQANEQETPPTPTPGTAPDGPGAPPPGQEVPGGAATGSDGVAADTATTPDPEAAGTVPDDQAADTREPRHGPVSIRMLDEPPVAMPRTKAQQEADVRAAAELIRKLADSGDTTDELDNYFPRVKERFKLGQIGYVMDGSGIRVLLKVNSEESVSIHEEVQRLEQSLIQGDPSRATRVEYHTDDRTYSSLSDPAYTRTQSGMGVRMVADPLTPLHGQGSGPRGTALADVFELLETQGETGSHGYIKGHLLNDNLGGPGEDRNLFPITQTANSRHHSEIENTVKELVNDRHFWVRYNVAMRETDQMRYIDRAGSPRLAINSVIDARLEVLKSDLRSTREVVRVSIPSRFNPDRGHVDYRDISRSQLQQVVDQQGVDAATAQAEIDRREDLTRRFDTAPENQVDGESENDLLRELRSDTTTEFQQDTDVTQDQILLSTARSGADRALILEQDTITALRGLAGLNAADSPFEGAATLDKRLADAAIGTSSHTLLVQTAEAALQARRHSGDGDLSEVSTLSEPQRDVLRQINSAGPTAAIRDVIGQYRKENNSLARLEGLSGLPSEADLDYFNRQFSQARQTERVAFAGLVAARYRTRSAGRSALQAMGKWGSSASFYTSLRTKILDLPAGDLD